MSGQVQGGLLGTGVSGSGAVSSGIGRCGEWIGSWGERIGWLVRQVQDGLLGAGVSGCVGRPLISYLIAVSVSFSISVLKGSASSLTIRPSRVLPALKL